MKDDELVDLNKERHLIEQIKLLRSEESTNGNLWPKIAQQISDSDVGPSSYSLDNSSPTQYSSKTNSYTASWIPWAFAASLVVSVGSLTFSWNNLRQAEAIYAQLHNIESQRSTEQQYSSNVNPKLNLGPQIDLMEQEFKVAKVGLMSRIEMNKMQIDDKLLKDIQLKLKEIEQASNLLKVAINQQPEDSSLPNLLRMTYQQEITILTQLAKLDSSI